jgi:ribosomal protein L40E
MPSNPCHFCGHGNPADAQFCGGCGGQVNLDVLPCPHCGALNYQGATNCYQCGRLLHGSMNEAVEAAPPAAAHWRPSSRPPSRAMVGALVLTVIAGLAYYAYSQLSVFFVVEPWGNSNFVNPSEPPGGFVDPPTAKSGAAGSSAAVGAINRTPATADVTPGGIDNSVAPTGTEAVSSEPMRPEPTPTSTPATTRPSSAEPRITQPRRTQSLTNDACTEATAALGLCGERSTAPRQQEEPARNAGDDRKPSGQRACTEAAVALGLCKS